MYLVLGPDGCAYVGQSFQLASRVPVALRQDLNLQDPAQSWVIGGLEEAEAPGSGADGPAKVRRIEIRALDVFDEPDWQMVTITDHRA